MNPATWVLYLLEAGEISVGKAAEWLREYIREGKEGTLPDVKALPAPETSADTDAEIFTRAVVMGVARWEFFTGDDERGEVCVGGLRYATRLDVGVPLLGTALREALERHVIWKRPAPKTPAVERS